MTKIKFIVLIIGLGLIINTSLLNAQQFLTPVNTLTGDAKVVTTEGEIVEGDIRTAMFGGKGLMSFRIKDATTGDVTRFKAEDVKSLRVKMDGWGKMAMLTEQTSSLQKMSNANFDESVDREYIYYHTVKWPGKRNKYRLVQLLNAGFDNAIKVYDYPGKKTASVGLGGMTIAGGNAKTYVVAYGDETILVEKNKYTKKHFDYLFKNCDQLKNIDKKDKDFNEFASHVFINETNCQ